LAEPLHVLADPTRLTQVFVNLLTNAAKFTDDGGDISMTVERAGDEIVVKVRDSGVRIAPDLLPRIFEPFMQEDRLQKRNKGGLGLGLALVRSLLDLHGGRIQAFSGGSGTGSEFVVHLPLLANPAPVAKEEKKPLVAAKDAKRVLIVDDNED